MDDRYILLCILNSNIVTLKTGSYDEVSEYKDELESVTSKVGAQLKIDKIDRETEIEVTNSMKYVREKYSYLIN